MPVKFNDYSMNVKAELNSITKQWLHEASFEVQAHAQRNCKMDDEEGRRLRQSYKNVVDEDKGEAIVGSPRESVYWEEFGTGSHAAHGDGRKGWWVYVKNGETRSKTGATYSSREEAEEAAEFLRKVKKLDAYATNGREPNYTLENAFKQNSAKLKRRLEEQLGEGLGK
jgi:hypothetical protein